MYTYDKDRLAWFRRARARRQNHETSNQARYRKEPCFKFHSSFLKGLRRDKSRSKYMTIDGT